MKNLSDKIAKQLERKLSSSDITALTAEAGTRHRELVAHLNRASTISGRRELVLATDPAKRLDQEREDMLLEAECERLYEQLSTLRERHRLATIDEAPARAKAAIKRVGPAAKDLDAARSAYRDARNRLQAAVGELRTSRNQIPLAVRYKVALDRETFDRVADLLDWASLDPMMIKISRRELCGLTEREEDEEAGEAA